MKVLSAALLAGVVALSPIAALAQSDQMDEALDISRMLLDPPDGVDLAYGAFQRGYYLTALRLAERRAASGDAVAQTLVAEIHANGLGVPQDVPRAITWYAQADQNGDIQATFQLAMIYQTGTGVPRNRERAAALFEKAAEGGHMAAKYNLGLLHVEGTYAEPNLAAAAELIGEAAEAGLPEAQYDFAIMLLEGAGIAPDTARALQLLEMAAEQGLPEAQVEYATLLYMGASDGTRDAEGAARWYGRAAEAGNPVGQVRYAMMLASAEGMAQDLESAAMYRILARRQGLTEEGLDRMLSGADPGTLARAEERARYWPGVPPAQDPPSQSGQSPANEPLPDSLDTLSVPLDELTTPG
ncbi:tetratricopeptide repeat protein [Pelagibacterium sp.]|uniref:tetratricopeptide repeat protein n=1 Tax=Pelagibacterium sp. TaxID=1967288 RepID=UPI003A931B0D